MLHADIPRRPGVARRAADRGGQSEREEKYVSVFPHWWYIRCKIRCVTTRAPYTPMRRVNCPARYRAAWRGTLYARERRIVYTVVPYRWSYCSPRRCPYMQPVAYQCARGCTFLAERRRGSLPLPFFFLLIFYSSSSFFHLAPRSRSRFLSSCGAASGNEGKRGIVRRAISILVLPHIFPIGLVSFFPPLSSLSRSIAIRRRTSRMPHIRSATIRADKS